MKKKIIFFDIDGTLIGEQSHIMLDSTKRAIRKARENGHICIVNTGRTQKLVGKDITDLVEFDGYLYGCGTMVTYHGKTLLHETFSEKMSVRIIDALHRHKIDAVLEGMENDYQDDLNQVYTDTFYRFLLKMQEEHYGSYEEGIGKFDKFFAYAEDSTQMDRFGQEFAGELDIIPRNQGFYEIMPMGFSKATGIQFLAEKLHISMEDTVAIGDSTNDLSMLTCAHTAIAMGNAEDCVKEIADYVTTDVDTDGIWNALRWLGAI